MAKEMKPEELHKRKVESHPGVEHVGAARGVWVRSEGSLFSSGIAVCDHPKVGSAAWWSNGVPVRHAARQQVTMREYIRNANPPNAPSHAQLAQLANQHNVPF